MCDNVQTQQGHRRIVQTYYLRMVVCEDRQDILNTTNVTTALHFVTCKVLMGTLLHWSERVVFDCDAPLGRDVRWQ